MPSAMSWLIWATRDTCSPVSPSPIFDGAGEPIDDFFLTGQKMRCGALHLAGQPLRTIGQLHLRLAQSQKVGNTGLQFGRIEGLLKEVRCPRLDGLDADRLVGVRGHHDNGNKAIGGPGAQGRGKLDAIHLGHDVINDHQIVLALPAKLERLARIEAKFDVSGNHFADYRSDKRKAGSAVVNNKQAHAPPPTVRDARLWRAKP